MRHALQGLALLSCNAKREDAEGQLRAAAVTESKLKRDLAVLKDEKKSVVVRVSQLEGEVADAQAALAAARAGDLLQRTRTFKRLMSCITHHPDFAAALSAPPPPAIENESTQTSPPPPLPRSAPPTPPPPPSPRAMLLLVFEALSDGKYTYEVPKQEEEEQQHQQHQQQRAVTPPPPPAAVEPPSPSAKRRLCDEVHARLLQLLQLLSPTLPPLHRPNPHMPPSPSPRLFSAGLRMRSMCHVSF